MRSKWIYIITLIFYQSNLLSQNLAARNIALGGAFLTQSDILSASQNITKLSSIQSFSIAASTSNQLLIKEAQYSLITVGLPLLKNILAFDLSTYGFSLYRELRLGVAYSINLSPQFSLGLKFNYHQLILGENLGNSSSFYPDIGSNYRFNEKLELAILFQNITLSKKNKNWQQVWPVVSTAGIKYEVNKLVHMYVESEIELEHDISFRYGIEYNFKTLLTLRAGISSRPATFSFGIGLVLKNFKVDLASSYHSIVGFSPAISILYEKIP